MPAGDRRRKHRLLAQDGLLIEAGVDFNLGPNATLGVSYSGQLASDLQDNAVKGHLTWLF
jgi:outer membrane autotransporter protein